MDPVSLAVARNARGLAGSVPRLVSSVLDLPTFDDDANVTHVSVVTIPEGFAGYRYWMAYTPYPDATREDPHVVASNDNQSWEVPTGGTLRLYSQADAISDFGSGAFNSDTELVELPTGGIACYWRVVKSGDNIVRKTTTDGRTWSAKADIFTDTANNAISPSIVIDSGGTWHMWTVNGATSTAREVEHRTSADGVTWGSASTCTLPSGTSVNPWHIAVRRVGSTYYMLVNGDTDRGSGSNQGSFLYYWTSSDGDTWTGTDDAVIPVQEGFERYYRSHFEPTPGQPLKWNVYLANVDESPSDVWRISVHEGVDFALGHAQTNRSLLDDLVSERDTIFVPANAFQPGSGTTAGTVGNWVPGLEYASSGYNLATFGVRFPADWNTAEIELLWANGGTGSGDVRWRVYRTIFRDGTDLGGGGTNQISVTENATAGGEDAMVVTTFSGTVGTNDGGTASGEPTLATIGVQRRALDAEDTLSEVANLIGVKLRKAS